MQQKNSDSSRLSNLGNSSLQQLPRTINERDIFERQQTKYNIISIQPNQYNETIKKYPKYRLENLDCNYYKNLQLETQYNDRSDKKRNFNHQYMQSSQT